MRTEIQYPVALLLNRHWLQTGQWRHPSWTIVSVLPACGEDALVSPACTRIHSAEHDQDFLWHGLWLELSRNGLQGYYENLTGSNPSLFVLCHELDEEPGLAPISISASHADAEAHMESDGTVLVSPLNAPFAGWLANFVLQNRSIFEHQLDRIQHGKKERQNHA